MKTKPVDPEFGKYSMIRQMSVYRVREAPPHYDYTPKSYLESLM